MEFEHQAAKAAEGIASLLGFFVFSIRLEPGFEPQRHGDTEARDFAIFTGRAGAVSATGVSCGQLSVEFRLLICSELRAFVSLWLKASLPAFVQLVG
jgi:hypothetical protein